MIQVCRRAVCGLNPYAAPHMPKKQNANAKKDNMKVYDKKQLKCAARQKNPFDRK